MARKSTVDQLPEEIRDAIAQLRAKGRTLDEILSHLQSLELDIDISRSALGRYAKKIDDVAEVIKRSRIVAAAVADKFGDENSAKVSRANLEIMHSLLQNLMIGAEDGQTITLDPKDAMFLATAFEKLSKADKAHVETQIKVAEEKARQETKQKAAEVMSNEARKKGLSNETIESIKALILGVQ